MGTSLDFADFANEIDHLGEGRVRFEGALGGALDCGAVGERIAERDAEFDDIGAGFGEGEDKFVRGVQCGIACGDVGDDAEFAGFAECGEASGDTSRVGGVAVI